MSQVLGSKKPQTFNSKESLILIKIEIIRPKE